MNDPKIVVICRESEAPRWKEFITNHFDGEGIVIRPMQPLYGTRTPLIIEDIPQEDTWRPEYAEWFQRDIMCRVKRDGIVHVGGRAL